MRTRFESIAIGDTKGVVLNKLGNPKRTYFKENTQRWVYLFKKESQSLAEEKEVWFQQGQVVYADSWTTQQRQTPQKQIQYEDVR